MRLFVAILLPDEIKSEIRDDVRKLGKIKRNFRFIDYEQMHITLKFIGDKVSPENFEYISQNFLKRADKFIKPNVIFSRIKFGFDHQKKPRILMYDIRESKELIAASSQSHQTIKGLKLPDTIVSKERNKFSHHITVARSKRDISNSLVKNTRSYLSNLEFEKKSFVPQAIYIIQSQLTEKGPIYNKLTKIDLF